MFIFGTMLKFFFIKAFVWIFANKNLCDEKILLRCDIDVYYVCEMTSFSFIYLNGSEINANFECFSFSVSMKNVVFFLRGKIKRNKIQLKCIEIK